MLRAMVGALSLALLLVVLMDTANSAPGRRGGRATAARAGTRATNLGTRPGGGTIGSGAANLGGRPAPLGGSNLPTGPINANGSFRAGAAVGNPPTPPQSAGSRLESLQGKASQLQGRWQDKAGDLQTKLSDLAATYGIEPGGPEPFSPAWYVEHPSAWQITHPYAGEAAVAVTAVGLASFMAMETAALSSGSTTTVVYASEATPEETQAATNLAQSGAVPVDAGGNWMAVGVFAFRPMDAPNATRILDLAVNPQGMLRGTHYDLLTEATANITGAVDRNTGQVSWRIGEAGRVVFESDLTQLTQPQGQVRVHFPDGQSGQWNVTRLQQ